MDIKQKLLMALSTLFILSLTSCRGVTYPCMFDCPNDPLLTQSYEMDYMNFSEAWNKSYGTARVGIVDAPLNSNIFNEIPDSKMRRHDSGLYSCFVSGTSVPDTNYERCYAQPTALINKELYRPGPGITPPSANFSSHGDLVYSLFGSVADDNQGMSSICRACSLAVYSADEAYYSDQDRPSEPVKSNFVAYAQYQELMSQNHYKAMANAILSGNQVVNKSGFFGGSKNYANNRKFGLYQGSDFPNCQNQASKGYQQTLCSYLAIAKSLDVIVVASNGNSKGMSPNWPANEHDKVIGVGGTDSSGRIWEEKTCPNAPSVEECGSQFGGPDNIMAPAKNITVYHTNGSYYFPYNHGRYQTINGTSFSAPIISGVVAIMRSLNPLMSFDEVKDVLKNSRRTTDSQGRTYSVPNVATIIEKDILGEINGVKIANRLKPMFRLNTRYTHQGETRNNYLSTSIPQVAAAAWRGYYLADIDPVNASLVRTTTYRTDDTEQLALGYPRFRQQRNDMTSDNARAPFYIFGGHKNPFTGADDMVPLHHYALKEQKSNDPACYDLRDHAYTTGLNYQSSIIKYVKCPTEQIGYLHEGIEGYLLPSCPDMDNCFEHTGNPDAPQCLMMRYSEVDKSFALLMESELSKPKFSSYTTVVEQPQLSYDFECLGYVYPNVDSDDDLVLDGMEIILGTDPRDPDTDKDGMTDGMEYPPTSPVVSDPLIIN